MLKIKHFFDRERVVFLVLFTLCLLGIFVVLPLSFGQVFRFGKSGGDIRENLNRVKTDWPRKDRYNEDITALRTEIDSVQSKVIQMQQESEFLAFVSSRSKQFNVEIEVLQPLSGYFYMNLGEHVLNYFPVKIRARAGYHDLACFIDHLQNSKYFIEIKELQISSRSPLHNVEMLLCGVTQNKEQQ